MTASTRSKSVLVRISFKSTALRRHCPVEPTTVRHGLCLSRRPLLCDTHVATPLRRAGRVRPEIEPGLVCLWRWWGFKKVGDRAAVHQVGSDEPGKGKRACNDFGGVVSQAQQQEGDQRDRDLNADGVFGGSEEVADLQSLLDPSKEQLDRPSSLV